MFKEVRVKPFIFVGASHGGLREGLFAKAYPEEVSGMVIVDAGYENEILLMSVKIQ